MLNLKWKEAYSSKSLLNNQLNSNSRGKDELKWAVEMEVD